MKTKMKTKICISALLLLSNAAFGADCDLVKKDLNKAVDVPIFGITRCVESTRQDMKVLYGRYITGFTKITGNHIPYKVFYKNDKVVKIEFFNDPNDVVYASALM